MKGHAASPWAPLAVSAVALVATMQTFSPATVVPSTEPGDVFSAERAVQHLDVIARDPRPVGSTGHATTRAYLIQQLEMLGVSPVTQDTVSAFRFPGAEGFGAASVRNVIVRLPGTNSQGAVLLSGHYDGGSTGPAAGDCGACVVTLLEVLRAVRAGPPLTHDLIAIFTDAEEVGDLGAHAFATQHPWMRDVRVALNFEVMGNAGPASLYVTSPGNRWLIAAFARHAPGALSSSFDVGLFNATRDSRNACDLQDYLDAGSAGMGFIFAGNTTAYHTQLDTAAALDPRSVQQFGDYALTLTRHFANSDLDTLRSDDAVFFTVWPGVVLHYSTRWTWPLVVMMLLVVVSVVGAAITRHRLSFAAVLAAAAAYVVGGIVSIAVAALAWWSVRAVTPNLQVFLVGHYAWVWYYLGLLVLATATMTACVAWLGRWLSWTTQVVGGLLALSVGAIATAIWLPAWSYLCMWPALAATPWVALETHSDSQRRPRWTAVAASVAAAVLVTIVAPVFVPPSLFAGFMVRLDSMSGLPFLAVPAFFAALVTGFVWLLSRTLRAEPRGRREWWGPVALGVVALALLAIGTARSGFSADRPRPEQVRYELDADTRRAEWVTNDLHLGSWTTAFIPADTRRTPGVRHGMPGGPVTFRTPAPLAPLPAPQLRVLEDSALDGRREVRVHLRSPRGAPLLEVRVAATARIVKAAIAGQTLDLKGYAPAERGALWFNYAALPAAGVELTLSIADRSAITIALADSADGVPAIDGWPRMARPSATMPTPGGTSDGTVVRRAIVLAESSAPATRRGNDGVNQSVRLVVTER